MPTSASLKELVNDPEKESPATNPLYDKDEVFNDTDVVVSYDLFDAVIPETIKDLAVTVAVVI